MTEPYKPRIGLEVTPEQFRKLQQYIPWGIRRTLFSAIIDDLIDAIEKTGQGQALIGAIVARQIHLNMLIKEIKNVDGPSQSPPSNGATA